MAVPELEVGRRLLPSQIDYLAQNEPKKIWGAIPRHPADVSIGFREISYEQFGIAIDRAAWWLSKHLSGVDGDFETLTYNGPFDAQFPIIAMAAAKCGKRILMISPWVTPAAQVHLLKQSKCTTYFHSPYFTPRLQPIFEAVPEVRAIEAPKLGDWLDSTEETLPFPYEMSWDESAKKDWIIFHTSGTTGLPKMIIYTHEMMASFDVAKLMPDDYDEDVMVSQFTGQRFFTTIPPCHTLGMTAALQWPAFLGNVYVGGPSAGPITASQAIDVMRLGAVQGLVMNPAMIEDVCRQPDGLEKLRGLEWISFIGAPISQHTAMQLNSHTLVMPGMGTTEAGTYFSIASRDLDGWERYHFRPANGIVMEPRGDDLYELVFHRKPEYERWQQVFKVFPDLDRFPTKDLWSKHPTAADSWRFVGRLDDVVVLGSGTKLMATDLQALLRQAPGVRGVLVGGEMRHRPFLLVDLLEQKALSEKDRETKLAEIWPHIEKVNEQCIEKIRFTPELVLFTDPSKPVPLTLKGDIVRWRAVDLYNAEIDRLYALHEAYEASVVGTTTDVKTVVVENITPLTAVDD